MKTKIIGLTTEILDIKVRESLGLDDNFFHPDRGYKYLQRLSLKKATMSEWDYQLMLMRNHNLLYHTAYGK